MRNTLLLFLLFIGLTNFAGNNDCPAIGDANKKALQDLNKKKNRPVSTPNNINTDVTLGQMYNSGDELDKFNQSEAVTVQGYLFDAKQEAGESCNCHTTDINERDIHIYISPTKKASKIGDCVVVEITGKGKEAHPEWTASYIKRMKGHKVTVTGYLLYDFEHTNVSYESNPDASTINRHTVWEVHPVTNIQVTD